MSLIERIRARPRLQVGERPNLDALRSSARAIEDAFPGLSKAPAVSIQQAIAKVSAALSEWQWDSVTTGMVSMACRAFLRGEVQNRGVQDFLVREMEATTIRPLLDAACEAFFDGWERGHARTRWLARLIQDKSPSLSGRWNGLFQAIPDFLDADQGTRRVAEKMHRQPDAFRWLLGCGVAAPHGGPLMRQIHLDWLSAMAPVRTRESCERVFAWIRPEGFPPIDHELAAVAIDKLLEPWHQTMPEASYRQELLDRLLNAYGDPRNARREFWPLTSDASRQVLRRWLAGQSMDALLRVITQATEATTSMWPPRHHFWKGLHERGVVSEAWVVLSPNAARIADDLYAETREETYKMAGRQTARSRKDTCLLIMRVGRYVVVEGSHDYRVHLFNASDQRAPQLYRDEYDAEAITLPADDPMARRHDPQGNWMRWVQERVLR
ncbi:EH signature domain-containing protein [Rhizobium chutanense]|uniref:Zorya protein ZorC EH domain-containing protein n=1 Tax=Rhizobium chutanense TaxID=2035448 RepID=A0A3S0SJL0_9HYPH|nr:EH signature domain-containing protein [Rhizobium chutanense]RUM08314.1 hypothetical protein EFR84_05860 [Rhizobium chutanense]